MYFPKTYCQSGIFREKFIFANRVKRHICDVKYSRLGHDIPISLNDRVISPFRKGFIFTKLRENKTLAKISKFTVCGSRKFRQEWSPETLAYFTLGRVDTPREAIGPHSGPKHSRRVSAPVFLRKHMTTWDFLGEGGGGPPFPPLD